MKPLLSLSTLALLLFLPCAWSHDDLAKVTVFTLDDASEVQALRFSTLQSEGEMQYCLTLLDGQKLNLPSSRVRERTEIALRVVDLPEFAQTEIKKAAEARAAAGKSEIPNVDLSNRELITAKLRENEAAANVKRLSAALESTEAETEQAKATSKNLEKLIAMTDAELKSTPGDRVTSRRILSARLAGYKADLQNLAEAIKHAPEKLDALRKDLGEAKRKLDLAKAESARLYAQFKEK